MQLQAAHPQSFAGNAYDGLLPDRKYVFLKNIPLGRLRVLKLPAQIKNPDGQIVPSGCGNLARR